MKTYGEYVREAEERLHESAEQRLHGHHEYAKALALASIAASLIALNKKA